MLQSSLVYISIYTLGITEDLIISKTTVLAQKMISFLIFLGDSDLIPGLNVTVQLLHIPEICAVLNQM